MERLPRILSAGEISPRDFNRFASVIEKNLRSLELQYSPKTKILTGAGQLIQSGSGGSGGGGGDTTFPWKLSYVTELIDTSVDGRVAIQYGEIDSVQPDGMTDDGSGDTFTIDPLDGTNGTAWIYLIITFDASNRRITSRTIGYTTSSGEDVPSNTDTTKYVIIGQVQCIESSGSGPCFYEILSQEITSYLYTDQAYYISDGENTFEADENAVYLADSTYQAKLESSSLTLTDHPLDDGSGDGEQILLEVDDEGTAKIHAQAGGDGGATFDLLADNEAGEASLTLDDGSESITVLNTSQLHINDGAGEHLYQNIDPEGFVSVVGTAGSSSQNFELTADDAAGWSFLDLHDESESESIHLEVNVEGTAEIKGTAGGIFGPTFKLLSDSGSTSVTLTLDDGEGNVVTLELPTNADGDTVSAGWQTLTDPCTGLSMKVLGTASY